MPSNSPFESHSDNRGTSNSCHALFTEIVDHLRESTGLPLPYFDRNTRVCIVAEETVVINLIKEEYKHRISLYAPLLASTIIELNEEIMGWLLEANLLWQGTQGATLGVHRDTNQIVLSEIVHDTNDNLFLFDEQLTRFIDTAKYLESELVKLIENKSNTTESELASNALLANNQNRSLNGAHHPGIFKV